MGKYDITSLFLEKKKKKMSRPPQPNNLLTACGLTNVFCWRMNQSDGCLNWSRKTSLLFEQEVAVSSGFHFLSALISRRGDLFSPVYQPTPPVLSILAFQEIKERSLTPI